MVTEHKDTKITKWHKVNLLLYEYILREKGCLCGYSNHARRHRAFNAPLWGHITCSYTPLWYSKTHWALVFYTCAFPLILLTHKIIKSSCFPEIKCTFDHMCKPIASSVMKLTEHSHSTLFIRVIIASLHWHVVCPAHGEEMRFTSWEEMVRDDCTPFPLWVTSCEFHICVPFVATDEWVRVSCIMDEDGHREERVAKELSQRSKHERYERSFVVPLCYLVNEAS